MLVEALDYVVRGWSIIPVDDKKHPLTHNGVKDASSDPSIIRGWWAKWPTANVAIATGDPSKMVVIDIDVKNGGKEAWAKLVNDNGGLPQTLEAITPSGGGHMYFKSPGYPVKNSVSSVAPGVDVRGDRGYVVAPPSVTAAGTYSWVDPTVEPSSIPVWLEQMLNTISHQSLATGEILEGVSSGRRDIAAFTLARRLRSAGTPMEITKRMVVMAATNDDPPLDESVAIEKVERVYKQFSKQFAYTPKGNGERLVDRHGDILRRLQSGTSLTWAVYEDGCWHEVPADYAVYLMLETTEEILTEALAMPTGTDEERDRRSRAIAYALRCQSGLEVQTAVTYAGADQKITVDRGHVDRDPLLLNCINGTLNLGSGVLQPHNPYDLLTKSTHCVYDPDAPCPVWLSVLDRVLPNPAVRDFFHRAVGYSLTGLTTEQVMFFLYGTGANGKSTVVHGIQQILGDYSRTGSTDVLLLSKNEAHPTGIADLAGARFVPMSELEQGRWLAESQLKSMTGGDVVKARKMYQDLFEFTPQFKIWMVGNHRPSVRNTDPAVWRRILLVPFTVSIPEEERDTRLWDRLDAEAPGILAWAVRGFQAWREQGLMAPEAVKEATSKYRESEDIFGQFRDIAFESDESGRLSATEAYMAYCGHCKIAGESPITLRRFNNQMEDVGYHGTRGTGNKLQWQGLRLSLAGREYISSGLVSDFSPFRSAN